MSTLSNNIVLAVVDTTIPAQPTWLAVPPLLTLPHTPSPAIPPTLPSTPLLALPSATQPTPLPTHPLTTHELNNTEQPELKASDIGYFKLLDLADASNTQLFIDEIGNAVERYGEARVIAALFKCPANDLARTWFAYLSHREETLMCASTSNFKAKLRRNFITPYQLPPTQ
jgi:hypothetical protein